MDFTALIKKSFHFAWNNRILWFFGLLAGGTMTIGSPISFPTSNSSNSTSASQSKSMYESVGRNISKFISSISPQTWILIIFIISVVVLVLLLVNIFISSWANAALVYSTLKIHQEKPTFKKGARAGLRYWWKFYLLGLVLGLMILAFIFLLAMPLIVLFLANLKILLIIYFILALFIFIFSLFVFSIASSLIITLGQRLIIHKGLGVLEAIRVAGALIKKHLGEALLTYVLAIALSFGAGLLIILALVPVILVFFILFFLFHWFALVTIIPALILLLVINGFWQSYSSVYWTLFYQHLAFLEGW